MRTRTYRTTRLAASAALATAVVLLVAGPAGAHVTVGTDEDHQGAADAVLTFRVPNEVDGASTTKVTISFPTKTPLASVKPAPKAGWSFTTKTVKFAEPIKTDDGTLTDGVGEVTWTATSPGTGIPSGGFDAFQVLVGPLPEAATSLAFPTVQTYSNGTSVAWIEPTPAGGPEPEHPAPVLELQAAQPSSGASPGASADAASSPAASVDAGTSTGASPSVSAAAAAGSGDAASSSGAGTSDSSGGSNTLGLLGVILGAIGVVVGGLAFARSGRARTA